MKGGEQGRGMLAGAHGVLASSELWKGRDQAAGRLWGGVAATDGCHVWVHRQGELGRPISVGRVGATRLLGLGRAMPGLVEWQAGIGHVDCHVGLRRNAKRRSAK